MRGFPSRPLQKKSPVLWRPRGRWRPSAPPEASALPHRTLSRQELLAEELLGTALAKGDFTLTNDVVLYLPETYLAVLRILAKGERRSSDPALDTLLNFVALRAKDLADKAVADIKDGLRKEYLRAKRQELTLAVREAERRGDELRRDAALKELSELPNA